MPYVFFNLFSRKKKSAPPTITQPTDVSEPAGELQLAESPELMDSQVVNTSASPVSEERSARATRATSPRTSAAKVAPPKATPSTRPGSKPAAKPAAGAAGGPQPSSPTLPSKPSRQALLDVVTTAPADPPPSTGTITPDAEATRLAASATETHTREADSALVHSVTTPAPDAATDLAMSTVPQLRLLAKELGLVGYSRLPKAQLVRVIGERLAAGEAPDVPDATTP